jgi:NAD-dependent dihydropyrimidine dehydrogenase PreA subunit
VSVREQTVFRVVLYEGDGSEPLDAAERFAVVTGLLAKGYSVSCARANGSVAPADRSALLVLGRFNGAGAPSAEDAAGNVTVQVRDISGLDLGRIVETVESFREGQGAPRPGGWQPWFPVIDYQRCTNCMQCLSFCLFGVYAVAPDGQITVQNEDNCKTNCPACSRVCPEVAIMFPKYGAAPINGDTVSEQDVQREKMKVDISALLGGDIYKLLRERNERAKTRFAKERDADRALAERQKCLVKLGQQLDIPPEVLKSLPSAEEIQRRAAEAQAAAAAALANHNDNNGSAR